MRRTLTTILAFTLMAAFVAAGSAAKPEKPSKPGAALGVSKTATCHWEQSCEWAIGKTVAGDRLVLSGGGS